MDKHVGRAEIRLKNLEGMPEMFTSYYEVLEKKLSNSATSQVSKKTLMTSGVGAIQAQIAYQYISTTTKEDFDSNEKMNWLIDQQKYALSPSAANNEDDQKLIDEFNKHLSSQRKNEDIQFKKFEEDYPDDSSEEEVEIDEEDERTIGSRTRRTSDDNKSLTLSLSRALSQDMTVTTTTTTPFVDNNKESTTASDTSSDGGGIFQAVSSFFGYSSNTNKSLAPSPPIIQQEKQQKTQLDNNYLSTDDDSLKTFPLLDTIGSWTMAKETNQVLRAIGKLLAAFVSFSHIQRKPSNLC